MIDVIIFSDISTPLSSSNLRSPLKGAGPHRIATEVRKAGFTCQVINLLFFFTEAEIEEVCRKFITKRTLVIGFSTMFWDLTPEFRATKLPIIHKIMNYGLALRGPKIAFGGGSATGFRFLFERTMGIPTSTFIGYADDSFINDLREIKTSRIDDLNIGPALYRFDKNSNSFDFNSSTIDYVPHDCLDFGESTVLEVTRGCIFKCTFCRYLLNGKSKIDYIKDSTVLRDELLRNFNDYGITNYIFSDHTFNASTFKVQTLHQIFTKLPFKINFSTYLRLDLLHAHREQIPLLKEMGLVGAFFGIESFNHKSAKAIGKGLHPNKLKDLMFDLKTNHWGDEIAISVGLITGLPYETHKSHEETIDYISDLSYCLVDKFYISPLGLINPVVDPEGLSVWQSEFDLNPSKYGFYFVDRTSNWKNMIHEIKSKTEAEAMVVELNRVNEQTHRIKKGSFGLITVANLAKYATVPKTLSDLCAMDRMTFSIWFNENMQTMIDRYVQSYKDRIMSL